ncbi:hypothetical protein LQ938_08420 [Microbacterium sp. cx-55]|uniref:hypothetical protein n=1 Tax=unclassified Microbacterium TaxID=2609290 RepID=UPI001CBEB5AE|nr:MULTISPECIES: hypothetical protein [unclassified Microbacterium]MBZ4486210.1 hypothetical protein [Microbacterium sp. cx-55]MCC4907200.1 hypothetical protein [Microbacterium sp. cx-59]UGB33923.1 hypothetical protein LQ938_08420 [Microbacterium sp. cx-55]
MTGAANQHIEIDGSVLSKQVTTLKDAASTFQATSTSVDGRLAEDAFGALCRGILVPSVTALAGRARELLSTAHELSDRMSSATGAALNAFDTLETEAADGFTKATS